MAACIAELKGSGVSETVKRRDALRLKKTRIKTGVFPFNCTELDETTVTAFLIIGLGGTSVLSDTDSG